MWYVFLKWKPGLSATVIVIAEKKKGFFEDLFDNDEDEEDNDDNLDNSKNSNQNQNNQENDLNININNNPSDTAEDTINSDPTSSQKPLISKNNLLFIPITLTLILFIALLVLLTFATNTKKLNQKKSVKKGWTNSLFFLEFSS